MHGVGLLMPAPCSFEGDCSLWKLFPLQLRLSCLHELSLDIPHGAHTDRLVLQEEQVVALI